jgi:hypothetical protein
MNLQKWFACIELLELEKDWTFLSYWDLGWDDCETIESAARHCRLEIVCTQIEFIEEELQLSPETLELETHAPGGHCFMVTGPLLARYSKKLSNLKFPHVRATLLVDSACSIARKVGHYNVRVFFWRGFK